VGPVERKKEYMERLIAAGRGKLPTRRWGKFIHTDREEFRA